ncbi:MAG: LysM peptidoglycan-binding domain-containing protein [Bacteroidota bacterium]
MKRSGTSLLVISFCIVTMLMLGAFGHPHLNIHQKGSFELLAVSLPTITSPTLPDSNKVKTQQEVTHQVKKGETLFSISRMYGVSISEIKRLNGILNEGITEGKVLIIRRAQIDPQGGIDSLAQKPVIADSSILQNDLYKQTNPTKRVQTIRPKDGGKSYMQIIETGLVKRADDALWAPGHYYCLHKSAPIGTIIKLTDNETSKSVYLKVMGNMSISEPSSLILRISYFAANKLGVSDKPFAVEISYSLLD